MDWKNGRLRSHHGHLFLEPDLSRMGGGRMITPPISKHQLADVQAVQHQQERNQPPLRRRAMHRPDAVFCRLLPRHEPQHLCLIR